MHRPKKAAHDPYVSAATIKRRLIVDTERGSYGSLLLALRLACPGKSVIGPQIVTMEPLRIEAAFSCLSAKVAGSFLSAAGELIGWA